MEQIAELLELQEANPHRIRVYKNAAEMIRHSNEDISEILVENGRSELEKLPNIGRNISGTIEKFINKYKTVRYVNILYLGTKLVNVHFKIK